MFIKSDASLTLLNSLPQYRSNSAKKQCTRATAVGFALHIRKNGLLLATKTEMVNYKLSRSVRSAFPAYECVTTDVKSGERGELVMVAAKKSGEATAEGQLRFEQM